MSDLPAELIGPGANGTVHFSGIVAATGQGEAVAKGDAAGQIRCVLRTLERLLAEEGMSFANLVRAPDQTPLFNIIPGSDTDLFATTAMGFEDDNVSGKIGLDYDLSDTVMLYASYSHGYRGAAFNGQARGFEGRIEMYPIVAGVEDTIKLAAARMHPLDSLVLGHTFLRHRVFELSGECTLDRR